jgi:ribosomal protein S18 acetylase RimI-like enzyme
MRNFVPTWYLNEKQIYVLNPCRFLSTAYWKKAYFPLPETMRIIHEDDLDIDSSGAKRYFRLIHYPQKQYDTILTEDYIYQTVNVSTELGVVADVINRCYPGSAISSDEVLRWTQFPVFDNDLWVFICEKQSNQSVALGIADFDKEIREGSLEWIQVLPEYRGRGLGAKIVSELLSRLRDKALFVTVSGEVNNPANPESLYRKCGFTGDDIWYVFRNWRATK